MFRRKELWPEGSRYFGGLYPPARCSLRLIARENGTFAVEALRAGGWEKAGEGNDEEMAVRFMAEIERHWNGQRHSNQPLRSDGVPEWLCYLGFVMGILLGLLLAWVF